MAPARLQANAAAKGASRLSRREMPVKRSPEPSMAELDEMSTRRYASSYDRALLEVTVGNSECAMQLLHKAYEERALPRRFCTARK